MRLLLATFVVALVLPVTFATADTTNHFGTFEISCGGHVLVIVDKPGSSAVVTFDGQPSTSVSILKGLRFSVNGEVVVEFFKPFKEKQATTYCTASEAPGELLEVWTLLTPRS
jgi:hypothetical protein